MRISSRTSSAATLHLKCSPSVVGCSVSLLSVSAKLSSILVEVVVEGRRARRGRRKRGEEGGSELRCPSAELLIDIDGELAE